MAIYPLAYFKHIFLLFLLSTFAKAGNADRFKKSEEFNGVYFNTSLKVLDGNNPSLLKNHVEFSKTSSISKKRGRKVRGLAGSVPHIAKQSIIKDVVYGEAEPHYLCLSFLSFQIYCRFDRGPPEV